MARFFNVGEAFVSAKQRREQLELNKQVIADNTEKARQQKINDSIAMAREQADKFGEGILATLPQIAASEFGMDSPEFAQARSVFERVHQAPAAAMNEVMAEGMRRGLIPPDTPLPGDRYLEEQMMFFDTQADAARVAAETAAAEPTKPDVVNFGKTETGERVAVNMTAEDAEARVQELIDQGFQEMAPIQISGTAEDAGFPTTRTQSNLQQDVINADNSLTRLAEIKNNFQRRFLTVGTKFKQFVNRQREKFDEGALSDEDRQELTEFTVFMNDAFDNLNRYVKEITGAQMSEEEVGRLRRAIPDPQADSPTEFEAKLNQAMKRLRLARARAQMMLDQGLISVQELNEANEENPLPEAVFNQAPSLDAVEQMMNDRFNELVQSGMSESDAIQQTQQEFNF